jgi:hypothetical protein
MIDVRRATDADFEDIWSIFHAVVEKGDTYAFDPDTGKEDAREAWMGPGRRTYWGSWTPWSCTGASTPIPEPGPRSSPAAAGW